MGDSEEDIETKAVERLKSKLRAHVEHPFRVIKQQFGYRKVPYKGLAKNAHHLNMLFALSNLYLCRRQLANQYAVLRLLCKNGRKNGIKATKKWLSAKLRRQKLSLRLLRISPERDRRSKTDLFRPSLVQ